MPENRKKRWPKTWSLLFVATLILCLGASFLPMGMTQASDVVPPLEGTVPTSCVSPAGGPRHYKVAASPETVHWGFYSKNLKPIISVNSQDYVTLETITHHAGDDYDRMIAGDPAIESIYNWTAEGKTISDRGPGVHLATGDLVDDLGNVGAGERDGEPAVRGRVRRQLLGLDELRPRA